MALVPNLRGAQAALQAGAQKLTLPVSASPAHSMANVRKTPMQMVDEVRAIAALRDEIAPHALIEAGISTAFGCTLQGLVPEDEAPIVWFYTPMALPLLQVFKPSKVIYDCMDELAMFKNAPKQLLQRESALLNIADVVFTGGPSLYQSKRDRHANAHCFSSSVDAAHFRQAQDDPALLETTLEAEYALCQAAFGWTDDDLRAVARTSIDASFANGDVKVSLREALARW